MVMVEKSIKDVDFKYENYRITIILKEEKDRKSVYLNLLNEATKANRVIKNRQYNRHRGFIALNNYLINITELEASASTLGDLIFLFEPVDNLHFKNIFDKIKEDKNSK